MTKQEQRKLTEQLANLFIPNIINVDDNTSDAHETKYGFDYLDAQDARAAGDCAIVRLVYINIDWQALIDMFSNILDKDIFQ